VNLRYEEFLHMSVLKSLIEVSSLGSVVHFPHEGPGKQVSHAFFALALLDLQVVAVDQSYVFVRVYFGQTYLLVYFAFDISGFQ